MKKKKVLSIAVKTIDVGMLPECAPCNARISLEWNGRRGTTPRRPNPATLRVIVRGTKALERFECEKCCKENNDTIILKMRLR